MKSVLLFVRNVLVSRMSQLFVVIHWLLVIVTFIQIGKIVSLKEIHFSKEPFLLTILVYLDMPALLTYGVLFIPIEIMESSAGYSLSMWFQYFIGIVCISFQWALIGYSIEVLVRNAKDKKRIKML